MTDIRTPLASSSRSENQFNYLSFNTMNLFQAKPSSPEITSQGEQDLQDEKLIKKVDMRIIPLLFILFMISFLDRANIGHARLFGLEKDLQLSPQQYAWSLSIFFVGYILFELPSNLMLKRTSPPFWFTTIMIPWGITMVGMAFVKDYAGLAVARFLLGVFEAG